jgi:hypothetical protein
MGYFKVSQGWLDNMYILVIVLMTSHGVSIENIPFSSLKLCREAAANASLLSKDAIGPTTMNVVCLRNLQ